MAHDVSFKVTAVVRLQEQLNHLHGQLQPVEASVCVSFSYSLLFSVSPAGYRCFKAVLFLTGLLFGSVVIFMLCYKERVMDTQLSLEASVGIGLGIGTLCGLVTMLVRSVGLFMVGLLLGLLLGVASLVVRRLLMTLSIYVNLHTEYQRK